MRVFELKVLIVFSIITILNGCGGGSSTSTVNNDPITNYNNNNNLYSDCALTVVLSGEINQSINWDCREGIGVGTSGVGFRATYGGLNPDLLFTIEVESVMANQLVDNRSATITIVNKQNNMQWQTVSNACVVNITINNTTADELGGSGSCSGNSANAVVGTGATGTVNISDFTFLTLNPL